MSDRMVPGVGDWFCFPQSVVRMDRTAPPTKEHRWLVVGSGLVSRFPLVMLRSTRPYGGIPHPAHGDACGSAGCRLDRAGWIRDRVAREIPLREFTSARRSCREPDERLIEGLMGREDPKRRRGTSRSSRR